MSRLILLIVITLSSAICRGQNNFGDFLQCENRFLSNKISKEVYLAQADSLFRISIYKRETTSTDSLIALLSVFKKTAWSNPEFQIYKVQYYKYLSNNAEMRGRGGESVFYAVKRAAELAKTNKKDAFEITTKLNYMSRNANNAEIKKIYESSENYLRSIWDKADSEDFTHRDSNHAIAIISLVANAYIERGDFQKAIKMLYLANNLSETLKRKPTVSEAMKITAEMSCLYISYEIFLAKSDFKNALHFLKKAEETLKKHRKTLGIYTYVYKDTLKDLRIKYFTKTGQIDAAIKLFDDKYNNIRHEAHYDDMNAMETRGHLAARKKDYKKGYELLSGALKLQKNEYKIISSEMYSLLYSHAEAESKRIELEEAEVEKKEQRNLIVIISLLFLTSILLMFFVLDKEKRRSKRKVQQLNKTADIEIEEVKLRASKEERKKIGQDLHDGLSGSLAGILYHIEDIKTKAHKTELTVSLDNVYGQLQQVYKQVREKSHFNFNALHNLNEDSLDASIQKIVNSALIDTVKKDIEIDKKTSVLLNTQTRVEVLRIIQEAMANIVKHAKKVTEVFVYLYEHEDAIILEIGNNGVVSAPTYQDGIGIQSIKSRVKSLGGEVNIEREKIGFQLGIKLPKE